MTADSSQLSSFPLSQLPLDDSGPPTVLQGPYMPLSTSTPIRVSQDNQQPMDSAPDESPFQQVIPSILQQSLYPSLAAVGTSTNTVVSPSIPFTRKVINDIEEQQRKTLKDTVEGNIMLRGILRVYLLFLTWWEILISHMTYDIVHTQKCHFGSTINTCVCHIPLEGIWLSDG